MSPGNRASLDPVVPQRKEVRLNEKSHQYAIFAGNCLWDNWREIAGLGKTHLLQRQIIKMNQHRI